MARQLMSQSPIPIGIQLAMLFVGLMVTMVSGCFILRGEAWARLLYTIWSSLGLLIGGATSPAKLMLIPSVLVFGIVTFFLFRPKANEYFAQRRDSNGS